MLMKNKTKNYRLVYFSKSGDISVIVHEYSG